MRPVSEKNKETMVKLACLSGGMEICGVYPLEMFSFFIPKSYDDLYESLFLLMYGSRGKIAPDDLSKKETQTTLVAHDLWDELQILSQVKDGLVIITKTSFSPGYREGMRDLHQKTMDLIKFPSATAYLFYRQECGRRLIDHNHVLFNVAGNNHINVQHWSRDAPDISFSAEGGYNCPVKFVFVA